MRFLKKPKNVTKKLVAAVSCLSLLAAVTVGSSIAAIAGTSSPISSIASVTPSSNFNAGGGDPTAIEQSQQVEIVVNLNTTVTASSIDKDDFLVNINGAPDGGWIDGVTNPAMDFSVALVGNNALKFTIFATGDAEVPNGTPATATNDFFAMRTKLISITAASGTSIPSITDNATSSALTWTSSTFSNVIVDTGARGTSSNQVVGNVAGSVAPSVDFTFTQVAAVRGMVSIQGTSTVSGTSTYIPFSASAPLHYAAPVHAHNFYTMSLADYASALVTNINSVSATTGCTASIVGTPGSSATIRLTKTTGYVTGETLDLSVLYQ